jgi:MSHA pilin protein MshC
MGYSKGFTLVELIAVLVIVALVAAAGRSLFFDVGVFRQRGFFEETLSAVRYAQKHAVATGCAVRVVTTTTGFTLFRSANVAACAGGPYNTPIADPSGGAATFTRTAPPGVALSVRDITFAADGSASASTTIDVGGAPIRVIAVTGYVGR